MRMRVLCLLSCLRDSRTEGRNRVVVVVMVVVGGLSLVCRALVGRIGSKREKGFGGMGALFPLQVSVLTAPPPVVITQHRGSELGEMITTYIKEGRIVPGKRAKRAVRVGRQSQGVDGTDGRTDLFMHAWYA